MRLKKRYPLLTVFLVILAINFLLIMLGYFINYIVETPATVSARNDYFSFSSLLKELRSVIFETLFFYFSLNYFNHLMVEKKPAANYFAVGGLGFIVSIIYFSATYILFPPKTMDGAGTNRGVYVFSFVVSALFFVAVALLIAYLNNLRGEKKHRKILEEQKLQLEIEKSQANFKFLKAQINPHFLHNTLNFLYAKSLPYSAELSEGILTLSDIMRYALSEGSAVNGKAALQDEIEHVRNVIRINQLRFSNNLQVNFEVTGVVNGWQIIPFVLITMVENAFKHGDLQSADHPIIIRLDIRQHELYFYCHNRKKNGPKEISTGLGLDNIRNRLHFAYGDNYRLQIKDEAEFYTAELNITTL